MKAARHPLRIILADSHVAVVAIAVLLLWFLDSTFRALWSPVSEILRYLFTAIAILDIPYISPGISFENRLALFWSFSYVVAAVTQLAAAWLLARWVYGTGPFATLMVYYSRVVRRSDV